MIVPRVTMAREYAGSSMSLNWNDAPAPGRFR
jgi:hypothetical protein